jgi:hypothetical protein
MTRIKTPECPGCQQPGKALIPGIEINPEQMWCHNAVCNVVTWNGLLTLTENAANATYHRLDVPE